MYLWTNPWDPVLTGLGPDYLCQSLWYREWVTRIGWGEPGPTFALGWDAVHCWGSGCRWILVTPSVFQWRRRACSLTLWNIHCEICSGQTEDVMQWKYSFISWKVKVLVAHSCSILCDPVDCSLQCSSVRGILRARVLEWVAIPFSRGSSWPRDLNCLNFRENTCTLPCWLRSPVSSRETVCTLMGTFRAAVSLLRC